ncbi:MAG: endonuclease III, partial [Deltaproteobacteria bacterium]|nr:endonuclease III [Deltaproteobacteria bacterium]
MDDHHIAEIIRLLERELENRTLPIVSRLADERRDPFEILISTLLSLRTKDEVTAAASERLFALASTPEEMIALSEE